MLEWPKRHPKSVWEGAKRKGDGKIIKGEVALGMAALASKTEKGDDLPFKTAIQEREGEEKIANKV